MNPNALLPISEQDIIRIYADQDNSRTNTIYRIKQNLPFIQDSYILADVISVLKNLTSMTDADFQEIIYQYRTEDRMPD